MGSLLFVDDETIPFGIDKFDRADIRQAGQRLDHFNGIMGLGNAGEMDIAVSVVELEVLLGPITRDTDHPTLREVDNLDRFNQMELVPAH